MLPADLSIVGLGLDIIGAVLIWRYGLPVGLLKSDGPLKAIAHPENEEEAKTISRYETCSKMGVGLLIAGFALQLGGTVWGRVASNAASVPATIHSEHLPKRAIQ